MLPFNNDYSLFFLYITITATYCTAPTCIRQCAPLREVSDGLEHAVPLVPDAVLDAALPRASEGKATHDFLEKRRREGIDTG